MKGTVKAEDVLAHVRGGMWITPVFSVIIAVMLWSPLLLIVGIVVVIADLAAYSDLKRKLTKLVKE